MVEEGLGVMISFDNLIDLDPKGPLVIKPLAPELRSATYLIRKKQKVLSRAAQAFYEYLKDYSSNCGSSSKQLSGRTVRGLFAAALNFSALFKLRFGIEPFLL